MPSNSPREVVVPVLVPAGVVGPAVLGESVVRPDVTAGVGATEPALVPVERAVSPDGTVVVELAVVVAPGTGLPPNRSPNIP